MLCHYVFKHRITILRAALFILSLGAAFAYKRTKHELKKYLVLIEVRSTSIIVLRLSLFCVGRSFQFGPVVRLYQFASEVGSAGYHELSAQTEFYSILITVERMGSLQNESFAAIPFSAHKGIENRELVETRHEPFRSTKVHRSRVTDCFSYLQLKRKQKHQPSPFWIQPVLLFFHAFLQRALNSHAIAIERSFPAIIFTQSSRISQWLRLVF